MLNYPVDDFESIKRESKKAINKINESKSNKNESNKSYKDIENEMNMSHGYIEDNTILSVTDIMKQVNKKKSDRGKLSIKYEDIRGNDDFNNKFIDRKKGGKMDQQIIEYEESNLTTFQDNSGQGYVSLENMNNLYLEGESLQTDRYSSLDRAFGLYKTPEILDTTNLDDKLKNYEEATDKYREMKPDDFSKKKWSNL